MRQIIMLGACVALAVCVTGCDAMNYLWLRIIGRGYSQVDMTSLESAQDRASTMAFSGSSLAANTVLGYKTRNGNLGKLGILSPPTGASLSFQFTTYSILDGSILKSSRSVTVTSNTRYDLEEGTAVDEFSASDFLWQSDGTLVPQGAPIKAEFYTLP